MPRTSNETRAATRDAYYLNGEEISRTLATELIMCHLCEVLQRSTLDLNSALQAGRLRDCTPQDKPLELKTGHGSFWHGLVAVRKETR